MVELPEARPVRNPGGGVLREQFPGRDVVQVDIDTVALGGGGIHCATQEQPELA